MYFVVTPLVHVRCSLGDALTAQPKNKGQQTQIQRRQSCRVESLLGTSSELEHTFSRSLLIHWTMLSPWSALSSTSNVCAHSLRLGSPSSLTAYSWGSKIDPTLLDLWSLDFSTTACVLVCYANQVVTIPLTSSYALRVLVIQQRQ
jgi:hypothetical protein